MRLLLVLCLGPGIAGTLPAQVVDWHRLPLLASLTTKRIAFDDQRGRMILFESSERAGVSATWEWVGNSWSLRHTATTPPPRQDFAAGCRVQAARSAARVDYR
ncbi:MAG: hypothetical protein U1E73_06380 [Planctomycetota bacterium]